MILFTKVWEQMSLLHGTKAELPDNGSLTSNYAKFG
jgi:hypothetical protein